MWWWILIIVYAGLNFVYPITVIANYGSKEMFNLLPSDLHKKTKMNWFGSIITSVVLFAILPLVWLGRFIYWLFHI